MRYYEVLEKLEENKLDVFTTKDLERISGRKPYNLIKTLKKNNKIERIKNGVYALKNTDDMKLATRAIEPSYISFLTALNYYELSDQMPLKIQLATTKRKKHKDYDFITVQKNLFFGYTNINGIIIAEKEKAIIDSLYLPEHAQGLKNIKKIIKENINKLNINKLKTYAQKNKTTLNKINKIIK